MDTPRWLSLDSGESVVWTGQPHGRTITSTLVSALFWSGLLCVFAWLFVNVFPQLLGRSEIAPARYVWASAGVVVALWLAYVPVKYLSLVTTEYALTDRNLYAKTGILSTAVTRMSVDDVSNTTMKKRLLGNWLEYSSVEVDASGVGTDVTLVGLEAPERFRQRFRDLERSDERVDEDEIETTQQSGKSSRRSESADAQ